jgi:hypothetical protein
MRLSCRFGRYRQRVSEEILVAQALAEGWPGRVAELSRCGGARAESVVRRS